MLTYMQTLNQHWWGRWLSLTSNLSKSVSVDISHLVAFLSKHFNLLLSFQLRMWLASTAVIWMTYKFTVTKRKSSIVGEDFIVWLLHNWNTCCALLFPHSPSEKKRKKFYNHVLHAAKKCDPAGSIITLSVQYHSWQSRWIKFWFCNPEHDRNYLLWRKKNKKKRINKYLQFESISHISQSSVLQTNTCEIWEWCTGV